MKLKKFLPIILVFTIIIVSLVYYFVIRKPIQVVHYHAGFLVYVDGNLQDFSLPKYMKTEPCLTNTVKHPPEDNQKEKAHLHDDIGDVVHVHRANPTWGDLFKNIDFAFPASESATGYINGTQIGNILSYPIMPYDSVVIISGDSQEVDLERYVTEDHIKEIEGKSETCGSQ